MSREIGDRAVVLGASMAGLLAARVLADAYAQVTLVDRDELPETPRTVAASPRAATSMPSRHADNRSWRSCSPGSPMSWSPLGHLSATC